MSPERWPWDAQRYAHRTGEKPSGLNVAQEKALLERFPPEPWNGVYQSEPMVVLDMHDRVILWYLPGMLTPEWQVGPSPRMFYPVSRPL